LLTPKDNAAMEAEQPISGPPKRKRRWFQFSLRTLLVFTVVVAIVCGWIGSKIEKKRRERQAVKALTMVGGLVFYDFQFDRSGELIAGAEPPGPRWLRKLLGNDFFTNVVGVGLSTPADMRHLADFDGLRGINAYGIPISDADLEGVKGLRNLRSINLSLTNVTDGGIQKLAFFSELEDLTLGGTHVTDGGLEHLKGVSQLKILNLNDTRITDRGLESLTTLSRLEELTLSQTKVTDSGLAKLKALSQLKTLNVWHTQATDAGVEKLQEALPNCKIYYKTLP